MVLLTSKTRDALEWLDVSVDIMELADVVQCLERERIEAGESVAK